MQCSNRHANSSTAQNNETDLDHTLELLSQEAAFSALRACSSSDAIISAALSVLAVISGDTMVRERTRTDPVTYGVHIPISRIQTSLRQAKDAIDPSEEQEQLSAQVQIKGCLFLGAIADGDAVIAKNILDEDGLCVMLDACDWYRLHSEVAKWGLWAIFVLCFDNPGSKVLLIRLDGLRKICQVLRDITDNSDVARHGIAILFDCMREHGIAANIDTGKLRLMALNAGLHDILQEAMTRFPQSVEITLMGKQMLQATGYMGEALKTENTPNHRI